MTNKELSQTIKTELKKHGYTSKTVSVSVRSGGYGDTYIKAKIKDPKIDRSKVKAILLRYREVAIDERSQEILQGGNTFVAVDYEHGIFDAVAADWVPIAREAYDSGKETVKLFDGLYLYRDKFRTWMSESKSLTRRSCYSAESLAELIYKYVQFGTIAV